MINRYAIIFVFLLVALSLAKHPHSGMWEQTYQGEHFYTEIFFQAEFFQSKRGVWIFDYNVYYVDLDSNLTKQVIVSQYLSGTCVRLKGELDAILYCRTEKYLMNGKPENFMDENNIPFDFALRLTSPTTAKYGRIVGKQIYEAYNFIRRPD